MTPFSRTRLLGACALAFAAGTGCTMTAGAGPPTVRVQPPFTLPQAEHFSPSPDATLPPNGIFNGIGRLSSSSSAGSGCRAEIRVSHLTVNGTQVRYQGFRGSLQPGGFVQMQSGRAFLYGVFDGPNFTGHLWRPHPECTYNVSLSHAAPLPGRQGGSE